MIKAVISRLLQLIPTLLGVTLGIFVIVRLTGDPADILLPPDATDEAVAAFRVEHGLDQPLWFQYLFFLRDALTGDLGDSIRYNQPVAQLIADRIPATVQLGVTAIVIAVIVGVGLGTLGALRRSTWIDRAAQGVALVGQAVPTFFLGLVLILVFGVWLRVLPTFGTGDIRHLIMPSVTLAAVLVPMLLRVSRGSVLDVRHEDFVRTARSKGMTERRVVGVHILKAALLPVVTVVGLQVGGILGGAVVTETVFSWPGIGQLLTNAIATRDFPLVQGLTLFIAAVFIVINFFVDILYRFLDPRVEIS